jgi:hypothetical protein
MLICDLLAVAHDVFVNRVVHDLLEQDVAAVVGMRAGADAPDIHARAQPDVLQRGQRLDLALVVNWCRFFSHRKLVRAIKLLLASRQKVSEFDRAKIIGDEKGSPRHAAIKV